MTSRIKEDIEAIGKIGKDQRGGNSRPALSPEDIEARLYLIERMREAGLEVYVDDAANIIGVRKGRLKEPYVSTGSHVDTVMNGGIFDGVLGVVGGLETMRQLNEDRVETKFPMVLVVFTDEEGNSFMPFVGSKYFAGEISNELSDLKGKYELISFKDALERFLRRVEGKVKKIGRFPYALRNHVELHVEQGPILYQRKVQIGVVTGIVGVQRAWVEFTGRQAHAGSTPMDMRSDPMISAAKTIEKVREIAIQMDMVGTVGFVEVSPNVINVIPGKVRIGVDLRSLSKEDMKKAISSVVSYALESSSPEGVKVDVTEFFEEPVLCSPRVVEEVKRSSEEAGFSYMELPSRAVHDSQVMAKVTDVGMIFVPSRDGVSHAPEEWTEWEDCDRGQETLKRTLLSLQS
ncbi:N-acetyl-lysine deacetylase [Sulfuracidifex tepidarius]|uniref:N-acetyl-lysine deacetylase n=1 Tax=Sulfuracidifex tepidarius TaxID=1294262 RepID=A0A510DYR5_9CREN|nr:M20 family metallo-hydrolase [Sulfuracidifex tepidarius]BBG25088.1 N-acetyl-lysine deacetylase [Sulfuracidifex tepidarius]